MNWIIEKDRAGCSCIIDVKCHYEIASHLSHVDADFIVKACNSYHDLLQWVKREHYKAWPGHQNPKAENKQCATCQLINTNAAPGGH